MTAPGIGWREPHYRELFESRADIGFIEVHSENFFAAGGAAPALLEQARARHDVSLHGVGLALGSAAGLDEWHLAQLERLVGRIDPVRVSDHACFARAPVGGVMRHALDLLPVPFSAEALEVMCANVQRAQERLRRPLLVENISAYVQLAGSDRSEPEFLNALAKRTGCRLLIDVNNIYVNALNARHAGAAADPLIACRAWLDAVSAECVGEIHLAGHRALPDIVIDDHGSRVCDDVWALYRHAIRRFGPVPTLVEWDTDVPALPVLLEEAARAARVMRETAETAPA